MQDYITVPTVKVIFAMCRSELKKGDVFSRGAEQI